MEDHCPDDHGSVSPLKTEDVSVTEERKEERKHSDGGDDVEEEVDPGEARREGKPCWRVFLSCKDKVGEGRGKDDLRLVDK